MQRGERFDITIWALWMVVAHVVACEGLVMQHQRLSVCAHGSARRVSTCSCSSSSSCSSSCSCSCCSANGPNHSTVVLVYHRWNDPPRIARQLSLKHRLVLNQLKSNRFVQLPRPRVDILHRQRHDLRAVTRRFRNLQYLLRGICIHNLGRKLRANCGFCYVYILNGVHVGTRVISALPAPEP